ncbi:MAG TPA: family 16 glycosylhydrolase [Steroidobacteraceae bacterium]|nr:family 16 glycosylhydrolase [Steroidobacteraceae bacterium]
MDVRVSRFRLGKRAVFILWAVFAAASGCVAAPPTAAPPTVPYGQTGTYQLLKNWTFGRNRPDATIRTRADLDREFYYRYIFAGGTLDGISTYWSYHRDYPDGDPRSLHVFTDTALVLKGRIPPNGGLHPRGIESGMLRAKFPVTPGMYVEMRAKLPYGIGAWPAFWLEPGVQYADGKFSDLPWPPEIDIFEFFDWQGRPRTRIMTGNIQVAKHPERFGNPHDLSSLFKNHEYDPGIDFSDDFHVFALDWRENQPIWLLDGKPVKQTYYEWGKAPPAHILVTNQLGIAFADMKDMQADEAQWDYSIDYIRVWQTKVPPKPPQSLRTESAP